MGNKRILMVGFIALSGALALVASPGGRTLKKVTEFDLPGPPGKRFDYLTITPDDHYLLSAHLAAGQMYVIDLRTNQIVATVLDTPGAEGVEYVPELKKAYTSNAGDNTIGVVDLRQMKVIKKIPTEAKPDGSAYAASFHKLYVSDERGKAEAIVDVRTDNLVKTLHFDSEAGMPQYDPIAQKVYVNLQDRNIFAIIDPATDEVVGRYPVGRCEGNHGMTLDPEHHRAFLDSVTDRVSDIVLFGALFWSLAGRSQGHRLSAALALSTLIVSILVSPFMPSVAAEMQRQLGLPAEAPRDWGAAREWGGLQPGWRPAEPKPIFPRIERKREGRRVVDDS